MRSDAVVAPPAQVTLRAHSTAPARVELVCVPRSRRALRTALSLLVCWGAIPFLLWVPPHYPWVAAAFFVGAYLAVRGWTGRYTIRSFAGICPRCGGALSLGADRTVDLPHTLTCFRCHFEPRLEVAFAEKNARSYGTLLHKQPDCVGSWEIVWLADEPFLFCDRCRGGVAATAEAREAAEAEREAAELLERLTDEGTPLI